MLDLRKIEDRIKFVKIRDLGCIKNITVECKNGFDLSISQGLGTYGNKQDLFEIAVLKGDDFVDVFNWNDDVKGYLTKNEVYEYVIKLTQIKG